MDPLVSDFVGTVGGDCSIQVHCRKCGNDGRVAITLRGGSHCHHRIGDRGVLHRAAKYAGQGSIGRFTDHPLRSSRTVCRGSTSLGLQPTEAKGLHRCKGRRHGTSRHVNLRVNTQPHAQEHGFLGTKSMVWRISTSPDVILQGHHTGAGLQRKDSTIFTRKEELPEVFEARTDFIDK